MLLVVADNAVARAASRGNTVPVIRTAYHIGGHYELYQAEGSIPRCSATLSAMSLSNWPHGGPRPGAPGTDWRFSL